MAEKNRNYSVFLLVLALVGAALFYGCGSSSSDSFPAIEYSITGSYTSEGLSSVNTSARAVSGLASGILIYSESDPSNYADVDTAARTFVIRNLKPGKHYIVFKHMPNGSGATTYIGRSSKPVTLTESNPVQACEKISAEECTVSIKGKVSDLTGKIITPTPILTLWGQNVEVDALTGNFTTPKMPVHTVADLIINAVNYQQTSSPLSFEDNPAYFEITAVDTGSNNVPPTINLSSKKAIYNTNTNVTFKAEAQDANKDDLEFIWNIESCTAANPGTLEKGGETQKGASFTSEYYWDAPEDDCMATISVMVREKNTVQKLSATAKLQIQIGTGHYKPNTKPIITSTTIYPSALYGKRNYTITCNATDTDGDALTENLTISPSVKDSVLNRKSGSGNAWLWTTPDLDSEKTFTLSFEVRDPKGNIASLSKDVKVLPTTPNTPPVIVSVSPTETTTVMSGKDLKLVVNAADNENDKLSFKWDFKRGDQITNSFNENTASLTWRAPILNSDTPISIYCIVSDPFGETATATFNVIITPDPNKKAPVIDITINGTTSIYNDLSLFKPNEIVSFVGKATDSNQNVAIDSSHYAWMLMGPGDSDFKLIAQGTSNATYTVLPTSTRGNYTVKMTATDIGGSIKGEETKDFRVNTLPLASILVNGNSIGSDGRMSTPTEKKYDNDGTYLDVFQYSKSNTIAFVASYTDIETDESDLKSNVKWLHNGKQKSGATYNPPIDATGTNILELATRDSKGEYSASATYKYFVNYPPVFDIATSSKPSYVDKDDVRLDVSVRDDTATITLELYLAYKANASPTYCDYILFPSLDSNPIKESGKLLSISIANSAESLLNIEPNGDDSINNFKVKLIAYDDMGQVTENNDINFTIDSPHKIEDFKVASGTYYSNQLPSEFKQLEKLVAPYIFEAKQAFSIESGSDKDQAAMAWTWYDNGTQIGNSFVDSTKGYTLNGYSIAEQFGTHTIRLEGRSLKTNVIASRSIEILINSTPVVEFMNATDDTIRYDLNEDAVFSLNLKEDNPNEILSLYWKIYNLKQDCTDDDLLAEGYSHQLPEDGGKSAVYMAGNKEKIVNVKWSEISSTPLTEGAKRVYVWANDQYGKVGSATVDILVNTLPVFNDMDGTRKIKIIVPDSSDNPETEPGYQYYDKNEYAVTASGVPIYLVTYTSMLLNFQVNATDAEDGVLDGDSITWEFKDINNPDPNGPPIEKTGITIPARFDIGENTIKVKCHDKFYGYYSKNGNNTIYDHMCIATASVDFYVWMSYAKNMDNCDSAYAGLNGTCLFNRDDSGLLYVQFGNDSRFIESWQVDQKPTYLINYVAPASIPAYIFGKDADDGDKVVATETPEIITVIQSANKHFMLMTNTANHSVSSMGNGADYAEYSKPEGEPEDPKTDFVASWTIVDIPEDKEPKPTESKRYGSFCDDTYDMVNHRWITNFPGGDINFPQKIISMTYSDEKGLGAMLLYNWKTYVGTIAQYANHYKDDDRLKIMDENTAPPLYYIDGKLLNITQNSKLRYLSKLKINQKLFLTDTGNNRLIRINSSMGQPNSIVATQPIDVCSTDSKYLFCLRGSGAVNTDDSITLYSINDTEAKPLTSFAKFTNSNNYYERAGKVKNPKSIAYYTSSDGSGGFYGGLMILEEGDTPGSNRIQVIRSNKADWLE